MSTTSVSSHCVSRQEERFMPTSGADAPEAICGSGRRSATSALAAATIAVPWMNIRQNSGTWRRTRPLSMVARTTAPSAAPMTVPEPPVTLTPPITAAASDVSSQPEARIDGDRADAGGVEEAGEPAHDAAEDVGEEDDPLRAEAEEGARQRVGADRVDAPADRVEAEEHAQGARRRRRRGGPAPECRRFACRPTRSSSAAACWRSPPGRARRCR